MSNFTGVAGDPVRDSAQQELSKSIGNESTRPRSIELAIRIENALFERVGRRTTGSYSQRLSALVEKLKHPQQGYELNGRLLTGMTTPERFIEEEVPEEEPELPAKKEKPKPKPAAPAPAPQPISSAPSPNAPAPSPQPIATPAPAPAPTPAPTPVTPAPAPQPVSEAAPMDVSTPSSPAAPSGGENKEAKSKTETSSYYFFKSTDPEQAKKYAPKPISPNELPQEPAQPTTGPATSKWNQGGTFEERDISAWARKRLAEMLSDLPAPVIENGDGSFSSDWTVTGEATAVFSRGKKRVGYELVVKSTYRGNYKGKSLSGRVEIPSLDNTYGANEYKINFTSSGSSAEDNELKQIFSQSSEEIRKRVSDFLKELADK